MRVAVVALVALLLAACRPDLGEPQSLVAGTRLLAVIADPPEAMPGQKVAFRSLVVSPAGTLDTSVTWSLCLGAKSVSEENVVGDDCIFDPEEPFGAGQNAVATLPDDACARFGPDVPAPVPGEPPLRPRDADITGGYYQPLRAAFLDDGGRPIAGVELVRILCNLPSASLATIQMYRMRYHLNANPSFGAIGQLDGDTLGSLPTEVAAGQRVTFAVTWPAEAAETFPVFDLASRALVDAHESMRASWFATAGDFGSDRTGRAADDLATDTENDWTAPETPGVVHFWIILRDDRGGSAVTSFEVTVN